jgi:hypothetical protein
MFFIESRFKMPHLTAFLLVFVLGGVGGVGRTFAGDDGLRVDPRVDLAALSKRPNEVVVRSSVSSGRVLVDASAVLEGVDCALLAANSLDFDRYTRMGMPNLKASRIVDRTPDSRFIYVWSHMVLASPLGEQSSQHYLEVEALPEGSRWNLVSRRSNWEHPEASRFDALDGTWYAIPFPGDPSDCSKGRVYVRYRLSMDLNSTVPVGLVDMVVGKSIRGGVAGVIEALAVHSRR